MCVLKDEGEGKGDRVGLLMEKDGQIFKAGKSGKWSERHWQECKR